MPVLRPPHFNLYDGSNALADRAPAPPWRRFGRLPGSKPIPYQTTDEITGAVNAALHLRRPLLVTGGPGTGKSSLAQDIYLKLRAERLLKWPINSKSTLADGLYRYDAVGRLRAVALEREAREGARAAAGTPGAGTGEAGPSGLPSAATDEAIGQYLSLGPLGTALAPPRAPLDCQRIRVLLIDEIDKSDLDLPNDLLDVLEDGDFVIPELQRVQAGTVTIRLDPGRKRSEALEQIAHIDELAVQRGRVAAHGGSYPFILITSNGEREFSPAFHRRCVHLHLNPPVGARAEAILKGQLGTLPEAVQAKVKQLADDILGVDPEGARPHSIDQVMNLARLVTLGGETYDGDREKALREVVARALVEAPE